MVNKNIKIICALAMTIIIAMVFLGCTEMVKGVMPKLKLNAVRIQVEKNSKIAYYKYIESAEDDEGDLKDKVTWKEIDTSQFGKKEIKYTVKDKRGNVAEKSITVDIVRIIEGKIFSPIEIEPDIVANPDAVDAIVNKVNELPKEWEPDDLEPVIDDDTEFLRKEANRAYTEFYLEAKRRGIDIFTISAYRSKKTQERNWNNAMNFMGEEYTTKYIAYPGRSEHQLGLTVDISYTTYGDPLM